MDTKKISLRKKIENIKEIIDYKRNRDTKLNASKNALITVNLANDCELFQKFSPEEEKELNPDIFEYIESKAYEVPITEQLTINFCGREIAEENKAAVIKSIKNHYYFQAIDKSDDLNTNLIKSISLGVMGVLVIALYLFLSLFDRNALFLEVISVVGSFAVWESVDYSLIERNTIKKEVLDILQLSESEITFSE